MTALDGYPYGPGASVRATADAVSKMGRADVVVVVEGISDQIALETAALGAGRDLDGEGVVVVPIGGAHAIRGFLGTVGAHVRIAGLCDIREQEVFRRALVAAGRGDPRTGADLEAWGFFACDEDLEDELVRAVGPARAEAVFAAQGDLGAFRSLQNQPAWRGRPPRDQMRRFLGSGATRKLRYARLLVEDAVAQGAVPRPVEGLLEAVSERR